MGRSVSLTLTHVHALPVFSLCRPPLCGLQLIDAHFTLCYTSRRAHSSSSRKPGQVGILTHREAKWIILILLEGSALHTVIERHAAPSLTLPRQYGKLHLRALYPALKKKQTSPHIVAQLTSPAELINESAVL